MFIAPWLGAGIALLVGATQDLFIKFLTGRNHNVYEPEFRLCYAIPGTIAFLIGYVGWGWGVSENVAWIGLACFFGITYAGCVLLNMAIVSYIIDAHEAYAVESQVILFASKNIFAFGMGYFFVPWYESAGPKTQFGIIGGVCAGLMFLGIPIYIFGKKMRAFWYRHPFLGIKDMVN